MLTTLELVSNSVAAEVLKMARGDFPPKATTWITSSHVKWEGPSDVPVREIDFSKSDGWQAAQHPAKVQRFMDKITKGWRKPVILIRIPGKRLLMVCEGHHRALAYYRLKRSVRAYTGTVDASAGPWDKMHAMQRASQP